MDIAAAFTIITTSMGNAKKLLEASRTLANAELKQMIAELAIQLADASLHVAELKHEVIRLQEKNTTLKAKKEGPLPKMVRGSYQFEGKEGLYCPKCYETSGKLHRVVSAMSGRFNKCSVCAEMHPAR